MNARDLFVRFDFTLLIIAVVISLVGVMLISSATHNKDNFNGLWQKQLLVAGMGTALMLVVAFIGYRFFLKLAVPIYVMSVLSLVVVYIYGHIAGGAKSWINLGGGTFQPSEFAKLALILLLARYFSRLEKNDLGLVDLIKPGIFLGIPLMLTALQPDLGTAFTMIPLFMGIALVSGLRVKAILALILIGLILISFVWMFMLKDYQRERLRSFMNPEDDPQKSGYQIQQSLIAIGSGGMFGKGLYLGSQSQLNFVPAQHTDFIFSVLGEELGFIGVFSVLFLYGALFVRALFPIRHVHHPGGILVVVGIISYLAFQTVINVLMSIGLFPTTGVPLPFLSSGGSSLLTNLIAVGLIIGVYAHKEDKQTG